MTRDFHLWFDPEDVSELRWISCPSCGYLSVSYGPWDSIVAVAFKHAVSHPDYDATRIQRLGWSEKP